MQACISASADGDTVLIGTGTYLTASLSVTRAVSLIGAGASPAGVTLRPTSGRMIQYAAATITSTTVISNLMVENGDVGTSSGGGIRVLSGYPPLFYGIVVSHSTATGGGGIRVIPSVPVTMVNVAVISNTSLADGGGLSVAGDLTLIAPRIERNVAISSAGGIDAAGALVLLGGTVTTNTAQALDGGGVRIAGTALISATRMITNSAAGNGGAIMAASPITLTRAVIDRNAAGAGGGAFVAAGMTVTLQGGASNADRISISNNVARAGDGGGLHADGFVRVFGQADFSGNAAPLGEGGAFHVRDLGDDFPNSTSAQWTGNASGSHGGAIRALGGVNMCPSHPTFLSNSAGGGSVADGGAIHATGAIFLCTGSTPSAGNSARLGGAFFSSSTVFLNTHDVGANSAQFGGCVYASVAITFNSADAIGCTASADGGAAEAPQVAILGNSVAQFHHNTARGAGGLVRAEGILVKDALIYSNTAASGGALSGINEVRISNASLLSNTAKTDGGAVSVTLRLLITDSVFSNNTVTATAGTGGAVAVYGSAAITGTRFERNKVAQSGGIGGAIFSAGPALVTGSLFLSNTALSGAGGGYAGGPITLTGGTFVANRAQNGGGISTTLALVQGSVFTANVGTDRAGGGILAINATVRDSRFISNVYSGSSSADTVGGGGIFANGLTVERTHFEGNLSSEEGAAIYISRTGTISQSTFVRNRDTFNAGSAVFVKGVGSGTTTVVSTTFDGNAEGASINGGGAIDSRASALVVEDSYFANNHGQFGGAIRANALTLRRSTFTNNVAECCGGGGAIYMYGAASIQASTFISNYADCCTGGGAIAADGFLSIADSQFISNSVEQRMDGGAILAGSTLDVQRSQFRVNQVIKAGSNNQGRGGAIYVDIAPFTIGSVVDTVFIDNRANDGGALACQVRCEIETSLFRSNVADLPDSFTFTNIGAGGAVWGQGDLSVKRSRFIRNRAGGAGGALYQSHVLALLSDDLTVQNSLFSGNLAANAVLGSSGNAMYVTGTINAGRVVFNTIVSDTLAPGSAVSIFSGTVTVIDNIVAGQGVGIEHGPGGALFENFNLYSANTQNLSGTLTSGGSSFSATPLFLSPARDLYYLRPGSPGIDAGTDVLVTDDVDGQPRPQGAGFDIGYDEGGPPRVYAPSIARGP